MIDIDSPFREQPQEEGVLPKGTTRVAKEQSVRKWEDWLQQAGLNSHVREFATAFVELIETRVGSPTSQHVAQLAEQAMVEAGRDQLTDEQVREVLQLLKGVWKYGASLRNWAVGEGLMD